MLMKSAVGVDVEDPGVLVERIFEFADIIVIECIDVETHHSNDRVVIIGSRGHCDPPLVWISPEDSTNRGEAGGVKRVQSILACDMIQLMYPAYFGIRQPVIIAVITGRRFRHMLWQARSGRSL